MSYHEKRIEQLASDLDGWRKTDQVYLLERVRSLTKELREMAKEVELVFLGAKIALDEEE